MFKDMPREYRIRFLPIDRLFPARENQSILELAMDAGVHINASCGGNGVCGKCKVRLTEGNITSLPSAAIGEDEYSEGFRLACQSLVKGDVTVEIPLESQIDKAILTRTEKDTHIFSNSEGRIFQAPTIPLVSNVYVELSEPTLNDNRADLDRLTRGISDCVGLAPVTATLEVIRGLGKILRDGGWKVTATVAGHSEGYEIVGVDSGNKLDGQYAVAIDIGTTTVWARLLDIGCGWPGVKNLKPERGWEGKQPASGQVIAEAADYNGQISYGEDVISRIVYARKKGGLKKLQSTVMKTINELIDGLLARSGVDREQILLVSFAGNTTMIHLLLDIDPTHIMLAPYTPQATHFGRLKARELGVNVGERTSAYVLPCVSSYVGGDIVSGVLASGMTEDESIRLFMDIGTNGEIVLGNKDWLLSASCSAGPAFEGGGIQFGTRASRGAIERVRINPASFEPMIFTVERARPTGICGSGLIDLVAGLLEAGLIDERGKFARDAATSRLREKTTGWEYVVCYASETQIDQDIVITEVDLDNLIRTKAAMFAGTKVLLDRAGLDFREIDTIIIAGGFGHYIDTEKAKTIGLLPELPNERFRFIGNGSLAGAHLVAVNRDCWKRAEEISRMITNVELSSNNRFMDEFVAAMFLPHTDRRLFPEVTARRERYKKCRK
ncbi:MAG TPA: ASKHA domain-containing protein [Syntrophorhabdaceae bacterium]|nr:ASKHA domain-containing protein [Syntrophorhabdaceae bacterium]